MRQRLLAAGVVLVAVVVCAWFGLVIHQNHDQEAAAAVLSPKHAPTPAQVRHADALLSSAATLNPDKSVTVDRAEIALAAGHDAQARAILAPVVAAEPEDLTAWIILVHASAGDPSAAKLAYLHVLALSAAKAP